MTFGAPGALLLLVGLVPLLVLVVREEQVRRRRLGRLGEVALLARLAPSADAGRRRAGRALALFAYACFVVALARPLWGEETELRPRRGLDVVFALDVSSSMRARDVLPDRLERAKAEVGMLLDRIGENRVGIVAFAGTAFPLCPLTTDVEAARAFLRSADPDVVPQGGTALAAGLETALNLFLAEAERDEAAAGAGRLLVVLTDGEDHEGDLERVAAGLKGAGVEVIVIGVGSALGEPIPMLDDSGRVLGYRKDRRGETVMTRMAPAVLERVADEAGGRFIDGGARPDLGMADVEAGLAGLEKRDFEARIRRTGIDRSAWPLGCGLGLLVLFAVWPERRRPAATKMLTRRAE